jgi:crotonobetainyl-CoA:carnitine CoA-transferase CaiB-like acyl-CoA transferase
MTGDAFTVDAASGVAGAFAILMALRHRRRTGEGQMIELAQAENFLSYLGEFILDYSMNGRSPEPQGNRHPHHAPHGAYPARNAERGTRSDSGSDSGLGEAWIAIDIGSDAEWMALCEVMGFPAWAMDERFASTLGRWQCREEMDRLLGAWTRTQDVHELFHRLQAAGISAGPVQDEADAYACPQLNERGFFEEMGHPEFGAYRYPGLIFKMANTPNHLRRHAVRLGEDNEYVYRELLNLSDDQMRRLTALGHIGMDYPETALAGVRE